MKVNLDIENGGLTEDHCLSLFSRNRRFIRRLLQKHVKNGKAGFVHRRDHNVVVLRDHKLNLT